MDNLNAVLLQAQPQEGGGWSGMIMIIAMIVIFYFFMIRPQSKKQKELRKAREAMKKGDKVVTAGGIHGRIKDLNDNVVFIEVDKGVVLEVDKQSVVAIPTAAAGGKTEKVSAKDAAKAKESDKEADNGAELEEAAGKAKK